MAKVSFYYSAMNAGKTTALLQSSYNYKECGLETIRFLPMLIVNRGIPVIKSRIGIEAPCTAVDENFDMFKNAREKHEKSPIACVLVDEAQFLNKDQVWQLCDIADKLDIPVQAYGLRTDFQGNLFPGSHYLLALADKIIEIKTVCFCGIAASMVVRIGEDGGIVTQGDQMDQKGSRYISTCRKHYREVTESDSLDSISGLFCTR